MIRLDHLHKYFNRGRQNEIHVINDISLDLPDHGMVAIFGKSGCGKTTLLNVIGGLDRFSGGTLTIEGQNIREDTDTLRNRTIGYIFQNYNLNRDESCFDNVADALRLCGMRDDEEIRTRVEAALSNVDMEKYKARTPDTLSGGQQQRIAIARAIVKNPPVILADEPTGNLDEANTLMIMDLLKQISRDHLVLLVTHEANLVDFYCDRVIELCDGQVVNVRDNADANGLNARDKNVIFLGELEKSEVSTTTAEIEYFGDQPLEPIRLRIINNGGKMYLRVDTPHIQILDSGSEIKLREGTFDNAVAAQGNLNERIDMSALPPIKGSHFGKLFSFASSLKSGFVANFRHEKRGKRLLRTVLILSAAVLVLMSAVFGNSIKNLNDVKTSYNHNVFYAYATDQKLTIDISKAPTDPGSAIDSVQLVNLYPLKDTDITFNTGFFETYSPGYGNEFVTHATLLPAKLVKGLTTVVGKSDDLLPDEFVMTTAAANILLENSTLGYISDYDDLLYLEAYVNRSMLGTLKLVGIVDSEETACYIDDLALAASSATDFNQHILPASWRGLSPAKGEAILYLNYVDAGVKYPAVGETIQWLGETLRVKDVIVNCYSYEEWALYKKFSLPEQTAWLFEKTGVTFETPDYWEITDPYREQHYFEYLDDYYGHLDEFIREYALNNPNDMQAWLFTEKGIDAAKYAFYSVMDEIYYAAKCYQKENGSYPTLSDTYALTSTYSLYEDYNRYQSMYWEEFSNSNHKGSDYSYSYYDWALYLNDEQFIELSSVLPDKDSLFGSGDSEKYYGYRSASFLTIHSTDPKKTEAWLRRTIPNADETIDELFPALWTPDDMYEDAMTSQRISILSDFITMIVVTAILSLCMYFIMRSALMSRIKEIGIYRAIGVSRRNLIFRFTVESLVLTTLTVFIGYLATSALMFLWSRATPMIAELLFYPPWLAGVLLVLLYAVCLLCGTLPIARLLRKTPSEILAKYDI